MYTIYIDVLIFTNIFQDFLLLLVLKRILHHKITYFRLISGSIIGGFTSLVALLPQINFIINLLIKFAVAILLVLVTFGFKNKKFFLKNVSTLFVLSFLTNGAIIFFYLAIKPKGMEIINDTVYFNISPLLLIILTLIIYFILYIYKRLFKNTSRSYEVVTTTIQYNGKECCVKCKIDSGCIVKEPFSGNYVIIVEKEEVEGLKFDLGKMRIIPFESLGGDGILQGFKADKVKINGKPLFNEVYIGLCNNIFRNDIKGLIPKILIED